MYNYLLNDVLFLGHENYFLKNLPEKKKNSFDLPGGC